MRLLKTTEEKPPIIMLENVKGVSKFLEVIAYEYEKRGYKMYYTLYNTKFWGLPQNRERYFVVGIHESIDKEFIFPTQQEHYIPRLSTVLENEVDEKYYISSEKAEKIIEQAKKRVELKNIHACITPDRVEKRQNGRRAKEEEEVSHTLTAQDRHGIIKLGNTNPSGKGMNGNVIHQDVISSTLTTNKGEGIKVAVETVRESVEKSRPNEEIGIKVLDNGNIRPHRMDERKSGISEMQVTFEENTAPTCISSHANKVYGESTSYRVRKLSVREYARLQGFPENYEIVVSNSQAYKQFGNAVSVPVAQAIATRIRMFLLSL
jgi:DNA-cytosine methyltransferase